ncbi:MAG: hypothetical protein QY323_04120 [Patescibacteria group bacterium]|nr:MAG: hypothetical protein QY323_04120 [Patescibacteria group bacterium]
MPEKTYGRKPGERCGACGGCGRLAARFQGQHNCNPRIGGGPAPAPSLHHLVCSTCGLWYESAISGSLDALLRKQVERFSAPETQPTHCPQCSEEVSEFTFSDGHSVRRYPGDEDPHERKVLCCRNCVLLLWSFPTHLEEVFKKLRRE